ncbi:MAG: M48 family metalloprotease [Acidobacteriota bacterium]
MMRKFAVLFFLAILARFACAVEPVCTLKQPRLRVNRSDIFTDQQEQWLGDAQADMVEPRYTLLPASESTYLDVIGQRLLRQLPPTPIHYTFRIYESPDLRAFSVAGGHVYISRKLVMDARSEDELAAMLAQEIGRIYIHHAATAVTRRMEHTLHVKKLGGRADVYDKFERMLNVPTDAYSFLDTGEQEHDELMADRVGIYAMIKAGYNPQAFATFLDRVNDNGGYTGNLFTDAFDLTPLISLRVRMADKLVSSLPQGCRNPRPLFRPGFQPFQQAIGQERINPIVPATPGLTSSALPHPINPALENVALSLDGKYLLAQDGYQIHVFTTSPLQLRFSVDALGAEMAKFTPDSQGLVFNYNDLHMERWQLATGQPADIQDFVDYAGCVQTSLSPDGNAMACVSEFFDSVWLKLADIHTGSMLYQNLHFYDKYATPENSNARMSPHYQALMHWSRDGRYFVAASGVAAMAYDLQNHRSVKLSGTLSDLAQQRFAFVGSDKMVSTCDWSLKTGAAGETFTMCYTTFPGGKTLKKFQLPPGWLASTAGGERLLYGPAGKAAAVLVNPAAAQAADEFRDEAVDVRGNEWAAEMPDGGIGLGTFDGHVQQAALPITPLTELPAVAFSPNGRYLALSNRARGAEWDLLSGKRTAVTNPFRDVEVTDSGNLEAALIPHDLNPSSDVRIDKRMHRYVPGLSALADPLQFGTVRIRFQPLNPRQDLNADVRMSAFDARSEAHLWSRTFLGPLPKMAVADGDQTVLTIGRSLWSGSGKLKHTSDLTLQFINPVGTVVEVISNRTGKTEHALFAPQLPPAKRRSDERTAELFGSLLAVYGNNNDTTVYGVSDGKRLLGFFGRALAGDDRLGMVAATNRIQELNLYDTATGKRLAHDLLDQAVIAARFLPERKQLLVLTASQRLYRIDVSTLATTKR